MLKATPWQKCNKTDAPKGASALHFKPEAVDASQAMSASPSTVARDYQPTRYCHLSPCIFQWSDRTATALLSGQR